MTKQQTAETRSLIRSNGMQGETKARRKSRDTGSLDRGRRHVARNKVGPAEPGEVAVNIYRYRVESLALRHGHGMEGADRLEQELHPRGVLQLHFAIVFFQNVFSIHCEGRIGGSKKSQRTYL